MIFGVLRDIKVGENRVICTPLEVASIVQAGHTVYVQKGAGERAGFPDEKYVEKGATILETAVPEYVTGAIMAAVRESYACEVVARRMAMDSAGKNASEMIADLQLEYNRARQGSITQEITEIVAGANA